MPPPGVYAHGGVSPPPAYDAEEPLSRRRTAMLDLYFWPTSNNKKVTIMLHEVELPYHLTFVDFTRGKTHDDWVLRLNPNAKLPVLVDPDGPGGKPLTVFESGAILMYLAEKTGKLMPQDAAARWEVTQWVFFQSASIGPMFGQLAHFDDYAAERIPYAVDRYLNEVRRLYKVLERRLGESPSVGGSTYSIADIMCWPWIQPARQHQTWDEFPALTRWHDTVGARPAVQAGFKVGTELQKPGAIALDEDQRKALYGRRY